MHVHIISCFIVVEYNYKKKSSFKKSEHICSINIWYKMLSSSLDAMLTISKKTSPQKTVLIRLHHTVCRGRNSRKKKRNLPIKCFFSEIKIFDYLTLYR